MTNRQSLKAIYTEDILPNVDYISLLEKLNPETKGDYIVLDCPGCGEHTAHLYPNNDNPYIICNHANRCGYKQHIMSYLNHGSFPEEKDWRYTLETLAFHAGVELPTNTKDYDKIHYEKVKREEVLADYWDFLRNNYKGSPAEEYGTKRGFDDSDKDCFGYVPKELSDVLSWAEEKGYTQEQMRACGCIAKGKSGADYLPLKGRLAGAFISQRGTVHNLWGRDITGAVEGPKKYINLSNTEATHKESPYGANHVKGDTVYWVEGYLDVSAARKSGITAVASGTCSIPKDMVSSLRGVKTIVVALDKDKAGKDGAFRFIEKYCNDETLKIYSINHDLMQGCKDIDELHQKHGKEAVQEVFKPANLQHAFSFAADYIIQENKDGDTWSDVSKEKVIDAAKALDKKVTNPTKNIFLKDKLWAVIQEALQVDKEALENMAESLKEKKSADKLLATIKTQSLEIQRMVDSGNVEGALKEIEKTSKQCLSQQNCRQGIDIKFVSELREGWLTEPPLPKEMLLSFLNDKGIRQGFLPKSIVAMLAGAGGTGKSHLVAQIMKTITTGIPLFGKYSPKKAGNVFLGMGENSMDDIRRLIYKISKDLSDDEKALIARHLAPFSFHGKNSSFLINGEPSPFFYNFKQKLIDATPEGGWDLIILDPVSRLLGNEAEKDNAIATAFISLLEQLVEDLDGNPTVLFAHHVNKTTIQAAAEKEAISQNASRGASALVDGCRWQVILYKDSGDKDNNLYALKMTKTNFTALLASPISITKTDEGVLEEARPLSLNNNNNFYPYRNNDDEEIIADKTSLLE